MNTKPSLKLGVIMDPLDSINIKKDSTYAMIKEALSRGWQVLCCTPHYLYVDNSIPYGLFTEITINNSTLSTSWYNIITTHDLPLSTLDIILLRKDPPFDIEYIYTTYILDLAQKTGVLVANNPTAIRNNNEKLSTLNFPEVTAPHVVTANKSVLMRFIDKYKTVIVKPLDGMGGKSIFKISQGDDNTSVILDTITNNQTQTIIAQKFIKEIAQGDKRILLVNGQPVPYGLARIPAKGEIRGNLAAGATGVGFKLSAHDLWICEQIGPTLKELGLYFVGIDVIGDYLTEINVTCPTCIQEIDQFFDLNISETYLDCLVKKLK